MNVVVLQGVLSRHPEERVLPSGDRLVAYEVTIRCAEGPAESVPVVWPQPPRQARSLLAGVEVVVTGRIRRRFFRAGGATQSRTEVVADAVVPARPPAKGRKAIERALAPLADR
jgi:single-strand DNA-binding protein